MCQVLGIYVHVHVRNKISFRFSFRTRATVDCEIGNIPTRTCILLKHLRFLVYIVVNHSRLLKTVLGSSRGIKKQICLSINNRIYKINTKISLCTQNVALRECRLCHGPLRRVKSDGSAVYMNGDRTTTPVEGHSRCGCGFKHYWNGREYDNMPERSVLHVMISAAMKNINTDGRAQ